MTTRARAHAPTLCDCDDPRRLLPGEECEDCQTWQCVGCGRLRPWDDGAHAGDPATDDLCDDCWSEVVEDRHAVQLRAEAELLAADPDAGWYASADLWLLAADD